MDIYLVGGAVRDELLGLPVTDRDWVVVGSNPQEMIDANFKPVGSDFPVFLHPETHEEYALARTERKTAPGYQGFVFNTDASVTLEDDLARRDLTINAIAKNSSGEFVDPFHGRQDIEQRILRHVSEAFSEDPVRVLRVARFMARFGELGFSVANETRAHMQTMVELGEIDALVPERVWQEFEKALSSASPRAFITTLKYCGALERILPEIHNLFGVPQPPEYHPEIDAGEHTLMVLDQATAFSTSPMVRFAALCHDVGKGTSDPAKWPSHHGHEERGAELVASLCKRMRTPKKYSRLAILTTRFHTHCHRAFELRPNSLVKLMNALDVSRNPEAFEQYLIVCEADARGRLGLEQRKYPQAQFLREVAEAYAGIDAGKIARDQSAAKDIPTAIHDARIRAVKKLVRNTD